MSGSTVHASCVLIDEGGILIRGASGQGKSTLAIELIDQALREGSFGRLVADDRVGLMARGGRLIARGPTSIGGRIEARGVGILPIADEPAAVVKLIVDIAGEPIDRLPEPADMQVPLLGVTIPRMRCGIGNHFATIILRRYRALNDTLMIL